VSGKGDSRRPAAVTKAEIDANWERTFKAKNDALNRAAARLQDGMDAAAQSVVAEEFERLVTPHEEQVRANMKGIADGLAVLYGDVMAPTTPLYREEDVTIDTWTAGTRGTPFCRSDEVFVRVTHRPSGCSGEATGVFRLETTLRARHAMERKMRGEG
jgi:hypothetical protein